MENQNNPFLKNPEPVSPEPVAGHFWLRLAGYSLFIGSVIAYGYAVQLAWVELLKTSPYDNQLYVYVWALAICWLGSVLLMWKWFRWRQNYAPGWGSLILSVLPLLILPMAYGVLQIIKLVERSL